MGKNLDRQIRWIFHFWSKMATFTQFNVKEFETIGHIVRHACEQKKWALILKEQFIQSGYFEAETTYVEVKANTVFCEILLLTIQKHLSQDPKDSFYGGKFGMSNFDLYHLTAGTIAEKCTAAGNMQSIEPMQKAHKNLRNWVSNLRDRMLRDMDWAGGEEIILAEKEKAKSTKKAKEQKKVEDITAEITKKIGGMSITPPGSETKKPLTIDTEVVPTPNGKKKGSKNIKIGISEEAEDVDDNDSQDSDASNDRLRDVDLFDQNMQDIHDRLILMYDAKGIRLSGLMIYANSDDVMCHLEMNAPLVNEVLKALCKLDELGV